MEGTAAPEKLHGLLVEGEVMILDLTPGENGFEVRNDEPISALDLFVGEDSGSELAGADGAIVCSSDLGVGAPRNFDPFEETERPEEGPGYVVIGAGRACGLLFDYSHQGFGKNAEDIDRFHARIVFGSVLNAGQF